MPTIPKWIADFMESAFSGKLCNVTIVSVNYINPFLKKITFSGDLSRSRFEPGQAIIFRVDDNNYRNYTPSYWNAETGMFEVIFHLHGNGPGSEFVSQLQAGNQFAMGLPRGFKFYKPEKTHHFFFGDETALGFFHSMKEKIQEEKQHYSGIAELDQKNLDLPEKLGLKLISAEKSENHALHAINQLRTMNHEMIEILLLSHFYLIGNAKSIQNFRKALRELGVSNKNITTHPYWADGKTGL